MYDSEKTRSYLQKHGLFGVKLGVAWLVFVFLMANAKPLFAISNPDTIAIENVKAYDAVLEADD